MKRILSFVSMLVVLVIAFVPSTARADAASPRRILISVGHSEGLMDETPLKHAKKDAARVRDVFVQMGRVKPADALVLENPDAAALSNAIARVKNMAETSPDKSVQLFFYFSGHGDRERMHLGRELYAVSDLSAKLAEIPAQLRVVVTDACRTANVRSKGGTVEPGFAITLSAPAEAEGSVWLYASADGEAAQESDELSGAIFTHHLLNGLSGAADANGDRRITLEEAYAYAHGQTMVRSFRGTGNVQRPSAKFDVKMHAPITITEIPGDRATVRVPQARDIYYLVSTATSKSIVAELWSSPERATELSLAPGKYVVQRRASGQLGYMEMALGTRETRQLAPDDFRVVPQEALARKGGDPDAVVAEEKTEPRNTVALGYGLVGSTQLPVLHGIRADYMRSFGPWAGALAFEGSLGERTTTENVERLSVIGGSALFGRSFEVRRMTLRASAGPSVRYVRQELAHRDADRLLLAGYANTSTQVSWLPGGVVALDAEYSFATRFVLRARGVGGADVLKVADRTVANLHATAVGEVGIRF